MKLVVFGYAFPHWKTQQGLLNLVGNGFIPDEVVLSPWKKLSVPQSDYRVTPRPGDDYLLDPLDLCYKLALNCTVKPHEEWQGSGDLGVILGARILKQQTIERFTTGILNLHPGILPGNRGLDNLKHSIVDGLPIGVTAHFIDERVDMGRILQTREVPVYWEDTIREVYLRQRNLEQSVMIETLMDIRRGDYQIVPCSPSEKFTVINPIADAHLEAAFSLWKWNHGITPTKTPQLN